MGIEHVNRRGERYYLLQGKTKSGKPRYFASRKPDGIPVNRMPDGYELHENPERGIVSVRKTRPSKILPQEREQLTAWTRELAGIAYFLIDIQGDSLVIYTPGSDPNKGASEFSRLFGSVPGAEAKIREILSAHAHYCAMLRFTLVDEEKRLFCADRWCFRGAIDDWFPLSVYEPLNALAEKYLPHLNRESFFELF